MRTQYSTISLLMHINFQIPADLIKAVPCDFHLIVHAILYFSVCKELYCRNGGKCAGPTASWCACPAGYGGAFCQKSENGLAGFRITVLSLLNRTLTFKSRGGSLKVYIKYIIYYILSWCCFSRFRYFENEF